MDASRARRFVELVLVLAAVLLWALYAWYCSRVLLRFRFPHSPQATDALVKWARLLPRWLGMLVFALVGIAAIEAGLSTATENLDKQVKDNAAQFERIAALLR